MSTYTVAHTSHTISRTCRMKNLTLTAIDCESVFIHTIVIYNISVWNLQVCDQECVQIGHCPVSTVGHLFWSSLIIYMGVGVLISSLSVCVCVSLSLSLFANRLRGFRCLLQHWAHTATPISNKLKINSCPSLESWHMHMHAHTHSCHWSQDYIDISILYRITILMWQNPNIGQVLMLSAVPCENKVHTLVRSESQ